jgi:ADP-ribose pyrophosphatase YjhB (NUDIX family)
MNKLEEYLKKVGTNKMCPAVFILKGDKLLIGLRNYTPDKWKKISVWTIPGGRCDEGESLEETLRRETAEEVGITDLKITNYLGKVPGAKEGDIVFAFKGETNQVPKLMEPEKFSEWKWCKLSEIPENFINPAALKLIKP